MEQPKETLPRDVVLNGADNVRTHFGGEGHCPLKIWGSKERPKLGVI